MVNHPCISVRASKQNHTLNVRVDGSASTSCLGRVPVLYCTNSDFNSTNKQLPACRPTNNHVIGSWSLPYCAYLLRYSSALEILGVFKIRPKAAASALLDLMYFTMHSTALKHSAVPGAQVSLSTALVGSIDLTTIRRERDQDFALASKERALQERAFLH